jgi:pimeloyl-ACP methyl ester carboxylesterase
MAAQASAGAANVVLVHGGFVDGSGWEGVYKALKRKGHKVSVVQNPTTSLADDVAATKRVIAEQDGPVTLVGHSYGGAVITEAGNDPKVSKLVYIAAFAPDKGESVSTLIKDPPPVAGASNFAAAGRVPIPRQGKVPGIHSRPTSMPRAPHSWLTLKSRGALML